MNKMFHSGVTRAVAEWVHTLKFSDIPQDVVEEAKNQILSVLGAMYAGYRTREGKTILRTVKGFGGSKEASLVPAGGKTSVPYAVLANAGLSMTLDYDDYLFAGHTGHSAVFVPFAWAEKCGLDGKDILLSQTLANEVEARAGAACLLGPQNGQQWSFIHTLGAACVTAKVLGFTEEQTLHSIGVSMYQPSFATMAGFMSGHAKVLTAGQTAMNGIYAALFAREGLEGCPDIFENEKGFLHFFTYVPLPSMFSGFSKTWLTKTLSYKIYPGCAYVDSTADCILDIVRHNDLHEDDIKSITVHANLLTVKMTEVSKPFLPEDKSHFVTALNFSIPYNTAACFFDRELTPHQFEDERIKDPRLWALAEKVKVVHDGRYTKGSSFLSKFSSQIMQVIRENGLLSLVPLAKERALGIPEVASVLRHLTRDDISKQIKERRGKKTVSLDDMDLSDFTFPMGARMVVETHSGKKYEVETKIPKGAVGTPPDEKRKCVEEKFMREASPVIGSKKAHDALSMIESFEKASKEDIVRLFGLLTLAKKSKTAS